jgi:hypothetical protein
MSKSADDKMLDKLQHDTFQYFLHESNPRNGLVKDKTAPNWPASIAAVGLALAAYPVGVECGYLSRAGAVKRTLTTLRFFHDSPQGEQPDATGYKGFYYHFLDMETGRRVWNCELSTIDSTFLLAGGLTAAAYFTGSADGESEIRDLADALYRRADWAWAQHGGKTVTHGWTPEKGFIPYRWEGYDEALLLYVLGLGSPTHALSADSYPAWAATYVWKQIYGIEFLYAGPLFIHQLSHIWLDLRDIQDAPMRAKSSNYFENSRRATRAQQEYAIRNPQGFVGYSEHCWGVTASDGPGPTNRKIEGVERTFYDYLARGVPFGPDDGTISPWAVVASLPFAPDLVIPTIAYFDRMELRIDNPYGFKATYNPTYPVKTSNKYGWVSPWHFGINQGPIVLMIENYRSGMLWDLMRGCAYIRDGLRRADFRGGWLAQAAQGHAAPPAQPAEGEGR